MKAFVHQDSIVRTIWGTSDIILCIFAGAAAEFALNKAVDWLYFTGRLPKDPLGRLFSTVMYARKIVFSDKAAALKTIDNMAAIHEAVEKKRGSRIPDRAYRDVLYMLIDYSIRSFELLKRKLSVQEKEEVYNVFYRVGERMGLKELPQDYSSWIASREDHLKSNLQKSIYTDDLFRQYRKHLGGLRFLLLIELQKVLVPPYVRKLLQFRTGFLMTPVIAGYRIACRFSLDKPVKALILPNEYKKQIYGLDVAPAQDIP